MYTFQLVRLVNVQNFCVARVLAEKQPQCKDRAHREPETQQAEKLVLLQEKICPKYILQAQFFAGYKDIVCICVYLSHK